jgi:hypothetical protein
MAKQLRQPSIVRYRAQFGLSFLKDSYVINLIIENILKPQSVLKLILFTLGQIPRDY